DSRVTELRQLYDTTTHANLRLCSQMVLLAHQGRAAAEIAAIVFRRRDTVARVLKRFLQGGIAAIPPRKAPGMAPTVTSAWKAELLRVIDLDPHTVGVSSANWTAVCSPRIWQARHRFLSPTRRCACISTPQAMSASGRRGPSNAKPRR